MSFPFSSETKILTSIPFNSNSVDRFGSLFMQKVSEKKVKVSFGSPNEIEFKGGAFRLVSNLDLFVPITKGVVKIENVNDQIQISSTEYYSEILIVVSLITAFLVFVIPKGAASNFVFLLPAIWLFGGNYALSRFRYPRFLRSVVDETQALIQKLHN